MGALGAVCVPVGRNAGGGSAGAGADFEALADSIDTLAKEVRSLRQMQALAALFALDGAVVIGNPNLVALLTTGAKEIADAPGQLHAVRVVAYGGEQRDVYILDGAQTTGTELPVRAVALMSYRQERTFLLLPGTKLFAAQASTTVAGSVAVTRITIGALLKGVG